MVAFTYHHFYRTFNKILHFLHLPTMRHIAAVDNRIYVPFPKIVQCRDEMPVGIGFVPFALVVRAYVRVAYNAKDEIRPAAVLPAERHCEKPPSAQPERRRALQELSP